MGSVSVALPAVLAELQKRYPAGLKLAVAVDGSQISDRATTTAAAFTNVKRGDQLSVLHISDKNKTHLPRNLQPSHLKHFYEDMVSASRKTSEWVCREKGEGQSTCEALTSVADKLHADLLFLGSFGRKGEKLDMLGTVSDHSLRHCNASVCIVRSTGSKFDAQCKFLFATDGSHAAAFAFCMLVKMLKRPMDTVDVVYVTTKDGTAEQATIDHYKEFMAENGVVGQAHVKTIDPLSMTVPQGVLDAVKEMDSDVLVMGISGYGKKKLGSVSEPISVQASCTTIIIKDRYEIMNSNHWHAAGARTMAREFCVREKDVDEQDTSDGTTN